MSNVKMNSSFRDPSGELYWENGKLLRCIAPGYKDTYCMLMESGLYGKLVTKNLLIPHTELENASVIEPEIIHFIS